LFTYFLLKKLQESKGDVDVGELFSYIQDNVNKVSVVNNKPQNPKINIGSGIQDSWEKIKIY